MVAPSGRCIKAKILSFLLFLGSVTACVASGLGFTTLAGMLRGFGAGFFVACFLGAVFFFAVAMMMLLLLALHRHERFNFERSKVE
jgi:uncharacterized membrane protein